MKFLKLTMIAVIVSFIGHSAYEAWAVDATAHIRAYADQGRSAGYVTNVGLTAVFDADGNYGISTANRYQLARRVYNVPLSSGAVVDTVTDSTWTHLFTVPSGKTITLKTASIQTRVEPDMNGAAKSIIFELLWYDSSGTTLDTAMTKIHLDKDSIAFDNMAVTLTRLDSIFTSGDILWAMIYNDSTLTVAPEGMGIKLECLLDE